MISNVDILGPDVSWLLLKRREPGAVSVQSMPSPMGRSPTGSKRGGQSQVLEAGSVH